MVWFRVDDNLTFHQKTLTAGNEAMGMWVRAGAHCSHHLTDGFVPAEIVKTIGGIKLARRLVLAQLWLEVDGGYQFHDWQDRNPSRAEVEADRKAAAERKERWRQRRRNGGQDDEGTRSGTRDTTQDEHVPEHVRNTVGNASPTRAATRPDPTRPDPTHTQLVVEEQTPSESGPRKRATRLPDEWKPTPADVTWQRDKGIDDLLARRALEKFGNYWRAKSGKDSTKLDWSLTWRNWLLTEAERLPRASQPTAPGSRPAVYDAAWEAGM